MFSTGAEIAEATPRAIGTVEKAERVMNCSIALCAAAILFGALGGSAGASVSATDGTSVSGQDRLVSPVSRLHTKSR